jgi:hypothetical protein
LIGIPPLAVPEHFGEYVVVYPETYDVETLYFPGFSATVVPEDEPENVLGDGRFPETIMVKSDGLLLPLNTLVVTFNVTDNPGCGIGIGRGVGKLLSFWIGVFFVAACM